MKVKIKSIGLKSKSKSKFKYPNATLKSLYEDFVPIAFFSNEELQKFYGLHEF